ncbi:OsmC family protein [Azospirillum sp. RWY-5-1]|uniref:OsmC family protein n=1 Tax=Azospirillum oleiclasticum TaxID=2735135 RepID=A0ABX2TEH3_9PROT|nr:OsmC family protein [Azospirillum oleiclasticum]NYZ14079.1 OsmC family protein [Azospirillum oleiclasticum]NYZ21563.1 OsmC family protein [Azospirillum oleiclasticum]
MPMRRSEAEWTGSLREGGGRMKLGSGAYEGAYSFPSRFENGQGTNPEELIAAAHAGCFSMALSAALTKAGFTPERIHTTASVHLEADGGGFAITRIELVTEASVPGIDDAGFQQQAEGAKANCPVSKALAGTKISLQATLLG